MLHSGKSRRRPAWVAIELMAIESGSSTRNSRSSVISVTAAQRRPPKADCNRRMKGHVAITNVAAHTVAARKGRRTRKETAIRPTIDKTASVVRVRSNGFATIRHSNAGPPGAAEQRGTNHQVVRTHNPRMSCSIRFLYLRLRTVEPPMLFCTVAWRLSQRRRPREVDRSSAACHASPIYAKRCPTTVEVQLVLPSPPMPRPGL